MKRHEKLRDLSDDHHTALVIARRCKRASEAETAEIGAAVAAALESHFEPHFAIEERWLVPGLDALGADAVARRLLEEHARLRALGAAPGDLETLREFGIQLEAHVRYEEREVFAKYQERLPKETLEAVAEACRAQPRACPTLLMPAKPDPE